MTNATIRPYLPELLKIAKQAGQEIMAVYATADIGETSKADNSPLTLADLASHQTIVKGLTKLTPDIPVLSEEAADFPFEERKQWSRFWLVDPLDGTKEFIKRNGEFTVNIALIENGKPLLGVVYAPVLDTCYYGAEGQGAHVQRGNENPEAISAKQHKAGTAMKIVASRSHSDARTQAMLDGLGEHECISMGSSLKLCLVAEGKAHFYPRLGPTMEWDTAAAHAVVNAAGGEVHERSGVDLHYNKADLHNPEFFVHVRNDERLRTMIKEFKQ
ncbi:MAG: 3'(2'),5'-bisphosphate nucleotidase CysQ [Gammaproteobacteria bacterium]|nr:3'(2'),5'-bisphosphate nucleotidase CysQ [Gammaproteobacteria bacterium]MBU1446699.1 3'(2'),5'-bisphosphate nucleotidase CysQ [Gammaproteobacteria bacterium]